MGESNPEFIRDGDSLIWLSMNMLVAIIALTLAFVLRAEVDWGGKKVSVVGDSYSDWKNYPDKSVSRENQMWWSQVIQTFGGSLERNVAKSGCAFGYGYFVCPPIYDLADAGALGNPDIVMVLGGLNDYWVLESSTYGCSDSTFRAGLNSLFNVLDAEYGKAQIYEIIPKAHCAYDHLWGLTPRYRRAIRETARGRGYKLIDLDGYFGTDIGDTDTPTYPHPTLQGMNKIAARVISEIRNGCGGYAEKYDYLETDGAGYMLTDYETNALTKIEGKWSAIGGESGAAADSAVVDGFWEQLVIGRIPVPLKLYYLKVYEGTTLLHSFVPVLDKYGNATLYDEIEDRTLVVRCGTFRVLNSEGPFVNYAKSRAYATLEEAYAAADPGEIVVIRENPGAVLEIVGRIGVGIDTRGFPGVTMVNETEYYEPCFRDGVWSIEPIDLRPTFCCKRIEELLAPASDGNLHVRIGNVRSGMFYSISYATNCLGPWTCVGLGYEQNEFMFPPPEFGRSFFLRASARLLK